MTTMRTPETFYETYRDTRGKSASRHVEKQIADLADSLRLSDDPKVSKSVPSGNKSSSQSRRRRLRSR